MAYPYSEPTVPHTLTLTQIVAYLYTLTLSALPLTFLLYY